MKILLKIITIILSLLIISVPTHGLTISNKDTLNSNLDDIDLSDGYVLFAPEYHTDTFLINNDKETIHTWYGSNIQAMGVYLYENGNIARTSLPIHNFGKPVSGGATGRVEILDWNSNLLWEYEHVSDTYYIHHDIEILPNGNILMISWEAHTREEAIEQGRIPVLIQTDIFWSDYIFEIQPTGNSGGNIIWEWHAWDHLIQDDNPSKNNYGIISENPGLININYVGGVYDWNHINSIDYHEDYDQILLSVKAFSEIWIIDHSTTTEQAAGHTGGKYGKGGDLIYRWGNPQAYDHGTNMDQILFMQHDAQWIPDGYPGAGNILIFNNWGNQLEGNFSRTDEIPGTGETLLFNSGVNRPERIYSSVDEIQPPITITGNYRYDTGVAYKPDLPIWKYTDGPSFFSTVLSGAQRLENGNTLICEGSTGRIFEVTSEQQKIWEYSNPYGVQKSIFRAKKYPLDYPGIPNAIPPLAPERLDGPYIIKKDTNYTYETKTFDPHQRDLYYQWDFDNGSYTDWMGLYPSGTTVSIVHKWEESGGKMIRVRSKNTDGFISEWSSCHIYVAKTRISDFTPFQRIISIINTILDKTIQ